MIVSVKRQYQHLVLGGTFDLLHLGHKRLIEFALEKGNKVTIGLASDTMARDQLKKDRTASYGQRLLDLEKYLGENRTKADIVKIDDIYGVAVSDQSIDGIVVTTETIQGAQAINLQRKKLGLAVIEIIIAPTILADDQLKISTTRIRQGSISRDGVVYWQYLDGKNLGLPTPLRPIFEKPFGAIITNERLLKKALQSGSLMVVSVGDEVTKTLSRLGVFANLIIIDFKINRKKQIEDLSTLGVYPKKQIIKVDNFPGTISSALSEAVYTFFDQKKHEETFVVNGEEDLAVVPVILLSPLGTKVVYGQRGQGVILIEVDEQLKEKGLNLVKKFRSF